MNTCSTNITPDSFSGIIFAFEGISRSVVLLNGPTGCKYYHSSVSDDQMIRQSEFDPLKFPEKWYFGQPRVPCSYLDNYDYVFGSTEKLTETLVYIRDNIKFDLLCIVNSPGAALIGDDLSGIARSVITDKPVITVETPGFSSDICKGYETGVLGLLKLLELKRDYKPVPQTVNILGLSLYHKNCTGDALELKNMLELCGITVNTVLCVDSDLQNIIDIPDAMLNIVIHPEYALETAKYLKKQYGTEYYVCDGPPIGFSATETFIYDICNELNADPTRFTQYSDRSRARAYAFVSRLNSLKGLPRGVTFAIEGTFSEVYSYTLFLVRYFGMVPICASVINHTSDCFREKLYELYNEFDVVSALEEDITKTGAELVFAGGNTIAILKLQSLSFCSIETALPTLGYIDVIPKTHLGIKGALLLVEQVINSLPY